jgi:hypothetical protein
MKDIITQESEIFIRGLFEKEITDRLKYHDILHTEYVVQQSRIIGQNSGLTEEEINIVLVAAWFHDSGFVAHPNVHEEKSQEIAREFLSSKGIAKDHINKVLHCIMAVKIPHNPDGDLLAKVLCDAVMAHLSEDYYFDGAKLSGKTYYQETVELFNNHTYFTEYGNSEFSEGKAKNIQLLHKLLEKKTKKGKMKSKKLQSENKKLIQKLEKEKLPGRGVESMFRLTARNQISLSSIADNKANILISVNSIILTILLTVGGEKISDYPVITVPAIAFLITCISTIIFAILATRPKISSGKFTEEDIRNKKVNLLFFGNFYKMKLEEYEWAIKELMADQEYLYSSMIRDQYSLGKVISRKYKLIRIAYTLFMVELILSSVLFAVFVLFV